MSRSSTRLLCSIFAVASFLAVAAVVANSVSAQSETMVASWYGPGFEGRTTASGEPFERYGYTAAHKELPFGTKLIVTYNGSSAVVVINDRGPFTAGRDIDLAQGAADAIGLTAAGEGVVGIEYADASVPVGPYSGAAVPVEQPEQLVAQPQEQPEQPVVQPQEQPAQPEQSSDSSESADGLGTTSVVEGQYDG
ncbi:MAG: septal ring lytic transglycosylase RlpA family protein, partial [Rubrobacter sp.]